MSPDTDPAFESRISLAEELLAEAIAAAGGAAVETRQLERLRSQHPHLEDALLECWERYTRGGRVLRDGGGTAPDRGGSAERGSYFDLVERLRRRLADYERYEVKAEVGRGGMGTVLRVWDGDLRRELAMKVIRCPADAKRTTDTPPEDLLTIGRFVDEAQVTGQLDHPGIVPVYDLGLDPDGHVYFTMPLIKGVELREIIDLVHARDADWTLTRALALIVRVCQTMAYAHSKRVVHRDLKPGNIMVGRLGEVFVVDWGLAKVLEDRPVESAQFGGPASEGILSLRRDGRGDDSSPLLTQEGSVLGTIVYMAPEQARGHVHEVDHRSDIYAIGAILYHLVAGQAPFVAPKEHVAPKDVLARVCTGPPRPLHELAPEAPAELLAICERAMSRRPEERYQDMLAVADDLSAFLEGRVVRAYEVGAWAEAKKWIARNRLASGSLAVVLLVVFGAVAAVGLVSERGRLRAEAERSIAQANERAANEQKERAERAQSNLQKVVDGLATPFPLSTRFLIETAGGLAPLTPGDKLLAGSRVFLEIECLQPVYVYVFNQNAKGHAEQLFPIAGGELTNPLAAGRVYRLPGETEGAEQGWAVRQPATVEGIVIFASGRSWEEVPLTAMAQNVLADEEDLRDLRVPGRDPDHDSLRVFDALVKLAATEDDAWVRYFEFRGGS